MRPWLGLTLFAVTGLLAGCVNTNMCGVKQAWKPCAGETSEPPGASGQSSPVITSLAMPTCAFVDNPVVTGDLTVSDADGDEQVVHVTTSQGGMRLGVADTELAAVGMFTGHDWSGPLVVTIASGSTSMPASFDIRVKVDDAAGGQSLPLCNTVTLVQ